MDSFLWKNASFKAAALFSLTCKWAKKRGNFKANMFFTEASPFLFCLSSSPSTLSKLPSPRSDGSTDGCLCGRGWGPSGRGWPRREWPHLVQYIDFFLPFIDSQARPSPMVARHLGPTKVPNENERNMTPPGLSGYKPHWRLEKISNNFLAEENYFFLRFRVTPERKFWLSLGAA